MTETTIPTCPFQSSYIIVFSASVSFGVVILRGDGAGRMLTETGNGQNTLGYRERMCLLLTGSCRRRKQHSVACCKAASQASRPTGRSPQASDAPLLGREVSGSQGSSLRHFTRVRHVRQGFVPDS